MYVLIFCCFIEEDPTPLHEKSITERAPHNIVLYIGFLMCIFRTAFVGHVSHLISEKKPFISTNSLIRRSNQQKIFIITFVSSLVDTDCNSLVLSYAAHWP